MAVKVPFIGTKSPFLHGAYQLGDEPVRVEYAKFAEEYRPKESSEVATGAFYADAVNKFAGTCVGIKIKNNNKWPVVKSIKSQRSRAMNPRCVFVFLFACFACLLFVCCLLVCLFVACLFVCCLLVCRAMNPRVVCLFSCLLVLLACCLFVVVRC